MYETIEEAMAALHEAELAVAADMGEEAVEMGYSDLVRSIALSCTAEVANELFRRTGVETHV